MLAVSQRIGSAPDVARVVALSELGFIAEQRGEEDAARSYHLRSLAPAAKLGDPEAVAQALIGLAGVHALGGRPELAARLLGAADTAGRSPGASPLPGDNPNAERIAVAALNALGEDAFAAEFQAGRRLGPEQAASLLPHRQRWSRAPPRTSQSMTAPPVRLISVPVMVTAQSDAAKTAALATS